MSEQGDLGDVTSGIVIPQTREVSPLADEVIDEKRGYEVVSSRLREGGIVLLGDTHHEEDTHTLFQKYEERLVADGIPFALGVELPYQCETSGKTTEEILQQADAIFRETGKGGMFNDYVERLAIILNIAKENNIPIIPIDNLDFFKEVLPEYLRGQNRNQWMANQIKEARRKGAPSVLTMVGTYHVQAECIPKYIDALAVKMGEDKPFQLYEQGSFDYRIRIPQLTPPSK